MAVSSRQTKLVLVLSGLVVLMVSVTSHSIVPLYDGVNLPDEPYRYVDQTGHQKTAAPDSLTESFSRQDLGLGIAVVSSEQGPQVSLYIDPTSIVLSTSTQHVTFSVQPLAPALQPLDGTIAGNVYHLSGSADKGSFRITAAGQGSSSSIDLRLPQGFAPYPTMEFRPLGSSAWQHLPTNRVGNDIYECDSLSGFGDYALVVLHKTSSSPVVAAKTASHAPLYIVLTLIGVVLAMGGAILLIRFRQPKQALRKRS